MDGSLLHKPNLKSMHSRLGNCTCNFTLRVRGRLNYLEDLLGQHKPCQTAGWMCTASAAVGGGHSPLLVQHHRPVLSAVQGFGLPPCEPVSAWFVLGTHLFALVVLFLWSKIKVKLSQSAKISWLQVETKQRVHGLYGFNLKS